MVVSACIVALGCITDTIILESAVTEILDHASQMFAVNRPLGTPWVLAQGVVEERGRVVGLRSKPGPPPKFIHRFVKRTIVHRQIRAGDCRC